MTRAVAMCALTLALAAYACALSSSSSSAPPHQPPLPLSIRAPKSPDDVALKPCTERCPSSPPWFSQPMEYCTTEGNNQELTECLMSSISQCAIASEEFGAQYPGPCGCPNYCMSHLGQGGCVDGACECNKGWTGPDCASPDCSAQRCSFRGTCVEVSGVDTCVCNEGWSGVDCSVRMQPLPAVQSAVPSTQYSPKDEYGNNHPVFNTSTIAQVSITLPNSSLEFLLDPKNQKTKKYQDATMWFRNDMATEVIENIGFRLKGGISRTFAKKTWKISFNEFVKGRTWYGLKKLVFKGMSLDPACLREAVSADVLYSVDSPTQRYSFAQLRVNGIDFGLVIMLEYIDKIYLDSRFDNHDGMLYKCLGDFEYLGTDPQTYKDLESGGKYFYDAKTSAAEDFDKIRDLIVVLNKSSDANFVKDMSEILDVDSFLRALAMEVLTGQSDGTYNSNNYYLYYDFAIDKFRYFRHDLDIAFGLLENFPGYDFAVKNIWTWEQGGRGYRLPQRVLAQPEFQEIYAHYLSALLSDFVNPNSTLGARMDVLHRELQTPVAQDYWHVMDYMYTEANYAQSLNATVVHPIPPRYWWFPLDELDVLGMHDFVTQRYYSAVEQLKDGPPASVRP